MPPLGYKLSKETKDKIKIANLGKKHSEETKGKMREVHGGIKNHFYGKHHTKEAKIKIGLAVSKRIGEKHPRWISDRTLLKKRNERNDSAYKNWVKQIKKRDKGRCRINNKDCSGYCEAHHILSWKDFPELRYKINNGITLCQAHHPRKRAEEKRLIPFFSGLVSVSNRKI